MIYASGIGLTRIHYPSDNCLTSSPPKSSCARIVKESASLWGQYQELGAAKGMEGNG